MPATRPAPATRSAVEAEDDLARELEQSKDRWVFVHRSGGLFTRGRVTGVSVTGWDRPTILRIKAFERLETVDVCSHEIPDEGLSELAAELPRLRQLRLSGPTTDEGLRNLRPLRNLQSLYLSSAHITDEGLEGLREIPSLREITLGNRGRVTEAVVTRFARENGYAVVREKRRGAAAEQIVLRRER
ncbi:MAG TPA: hypothetical protein VF796_07290 [Humisphaera sp.]